ncbi:MAG: hypothetical protein P8Y99_19000, partial [Calditrichaceae bacterium]
MKRLLFVNPQQQLNTPRSIRITNLTEYLNDKYKVHLLYFDLGFGNGAEMQHENISHHVIQLFDKLNTKRLITDVDNLAVKIRYRIRNYFQRLKDPFIFETGKLSDILKQLHLEYRFDKIIISVSPYSSYLISRNWDTKNLLVFDVGDPLFKNSGLKGSDKPIFRSIEKEALESATGVIITNEATKNFFQSTYQISKDRLIIIPQGI